MKDLYLKIKTKLLSQEALALYRNYGVNAVKYIDVYKGQYQAWDKFEIHKLPAVLFEWQIIHDSNANNNRSYATINLHLIYEQFRSSSSIFNDNNSLEYFDFITAVNELIENMESSHTGKLQLTQEASVNAGEIEAGIILTYQCAYTGKAQDKRSKWAYSDENTVNVAIQGNIKTSL